MWTIYFLIFLTLMLGIGAWALFVWSVKSGQYDDMEGPKYRMLEEEEGASEASAEASSVPSLDQQAEQDRSRDRQ